MNHDAVNGSGKVIYKVVFTGGPCGGKTTSLARVTNFFENLGWKVYRVNEVVFMYLNGGVVFPDLSDEAVYQFQRNLIYSMMQIEKTFDDLAKNDRHEKILIVCDRGIMDATAYMKPGQWDRLRKEEGWSETELRDRRYNQVVHMMSVAKGAPEYYSLAGHGTRHESVDVAVKLDDDVANAWVGHPYFDIIDNTSNFEEKIKKMLQAICVRLGIDATDRLTERSKKIKFLVRQVDVELNSSDLPLRMTEFNVIHHFLAGSIGETEHTRIRCRGSTENDWTYMQTTRSRGSQGDVVETKRSLDKHTYQMLLHTQVSHEHSKLRKRRYCFLWEGQYYQLDVFDSDVCPPACSGLILLETFTAHDANSLPLPPFLQVDREVTEEPRYRLFNLASLQQKSMVPRRKDLLLSNVMKGSFNVDVAPNCPDNAEFSKPLPDSPTK